MAQTLVNIRMDEDLKKSMEATCKELGMNMTTAFTIFAKKVSREKRIPFEVSIEPVIFEKTPDEWDKAMIADSKKDNEEKMPLDEFTKELGFNPDDLRI